MSCNLVLNKLIIEGEDYKRTLSFEKGINIIEGEMYSGKSLVLKLIDYVFGKNDSINNNVQKELKLYCEKVYLEFKISESTVTVERNLWKNTRKVFIYFCDAENINNYSPRVLEVSEYKNFLLEKMDLPIYKTIKYKPHSKERTIEKISFRDFYRYMYVDQHSLGTHSFMKYNESVTKRKNNIVFDIMFDFIAFDNEFILHEKIKLENEIEKIETEIKGLKSYLQEADIKSKVELDNMYSQYANDIEKYNNEKNNLIMKKHSKNSKAGTLYSRTNKKIIEIEDELLYIDRTLNDLSLEKESRYQLLYEYNRQLKEVKATSESYNLIHKTEHSYICPLCQGTVKYESDLNINRKSIEQLERDLNYKIEMVNKSLKNIDNKVNNLDNKKKFLLEELNLLQNALKIYKKNLDIPYISEIESINTIIIDKNNLLNDLNEKIKIFNKIDEKELEVFGKKKQVIDLDKKITESKINNDDKITIIDQLSQTYRKILNDLKLSVNNISTYIDYNNYIPYYNGASILEHESGGILVCIQIAYLSAILEYKKSNDLIRHPGILMLDTIGKYLGTNNVTEEFTENMIMDPINHIELYKLLINLSEDYQIIIVENIPPKITRDYVKYTFYKSNYRGLVNIEKNEKVKL